MRRRDFFKIIAASATIWPNIGSAQQSTKVARIGWMSINSPTANDANMTAFRRGMSEFGYIEGQTFTMEARFADGKDAVLPEQATELERIGVDVIVAGPYAALQAAKQSTTRVPIVMTPAADPVVAGIVKALDRPGGNVTGITEMMPELTPERIRLLKEVVPTFSRLAIMWRPGTLSEQAFEQMIAQSQAVAGPMGVHIQIVTAAKAEDFDAAFQTMDKERTEALIVLVNPMFFGQRKEIVERAAKQRLPAMYEWKQFVQAGGLISYGADVPDVYRRAAGIVDKILKGTKPGDIAVERPALFNMGVNLKTAKALGVTIPDRIRKQAVEIVE
jgi:putative tryptophan/tyrosine transport system substrate-binding protein